MSGAPAASTAPRRILSIWLPSLAIDRWRLVMGEQARALADAPLVLIKADGDGAVGVKVQQALIRQLQLPTLAGSGALIGQRGLLRLQRGLGFGMGTLLFRQRGFQAFQFLRIDAGGRGCSDGQSFDAVADPIHRRGQTSLKLFDITHCRGRPLCHSCSVRLRTMLDRLANHQPGRIWAKSTET